MKCEYFEDLGDSHTYCRCDGDIPDRMKEVRAKYKSNKMLTAERDRYKADADYFQRLAGAAGNYINFFLLETIPGFEGAAMAREKELYEIYQSILNEREVGNSEPHHE